MTLLDGVPAGAPGPPVGAGGEPAGAGARVRVRFAKHGKVRFTSHRDVARIWERALRRAGVAVAYSAGFTPRPRIAFGLALPTGYCSEAEYLDISLDAARAADVDHDGLAASLTAALPHGITALAAARLGGGEPSLQHAVTSCTWRIDTAGAPPASVSGSVVRALGPDTLMVERERKGRRATEDIRPAVLSVDVAGDTTDGVRLVAELATQPRAVRPAELLASLDPHLGALRVCRLHQWIATDDGRRREPLALAEESVALAGAPQ